VLVIVDGAPPAKEPELRQAFSGVGPQVELAALTEDERAAQKTFVAQARAACGKGSDAALAMDTSTAIARFEDGVNLYARGMAAIEDFRDVARCLLELGAAWMAADKEDKAGEAFRRALVLSPTLQADPVRHNPPTRKRFQKVQRDMVSEKRGALTIVGEPAGAEVWLDGARIGSIPVSVPDLAAGEHWVSVRHPGRRLFASRVPVIESKPVKIEVFLAEQKTVGREARVAAMLASERDLKESEIAELSLQAEALGAFGFVYLAAQGPSFRHRFYDDRKRAATSLSRTGTLEDVAKLARSFFNGPAPAPAAAVSAPPQPAAVAAKRDERPRVHVMLSILPLGIGQFVEKRYGVGAVFLTTEILLLALNITSFYVAQSFKLGPGEYRSPQTVEALKWVVNVSLPLLVVDAIIGAIDGGLNR
jgi:hypothetical protein